MGLVIGRGQKRKEGPGSGTLTTPLSATDGCAMNGVRWLGYKSEVIHVLAPSTAPCDAAVHLFVSDHGVRLVCICMCVGGRRGLNYELS